METNLSRACPYGSGCSHAVSNTVKKFDIIFDRPGDWVNKKISDLYMVVASLRKQAQHTKDLEIENLRLKQELEDLNKVLCRLTGVSNNSLKIGK